MSYMHVNDHIETCIFNEITAFMIIALIHIAISVLLQYMVQPSSEWNHVYSVLTCLPLPHLRWRTVMSWPLSCCLYWTICCGCWQTLSSRPSSTTPSLWVKPWRSPASRGRAWLLKHCRCCTVSFKSASKLLWRQISDPLDALCVLRSKLKIKPYHAQTSWLLLVLV